jgi:Acetyltransferase (GNAT) domain
MGTGITIKAYRTLAELEAISAQWEAWQNHVNNDFSHFKLVSGIRPEIKSPYVTVIEQQGQPVAMILGRVEQIQFAPAIGYLKPVKIPIEVICVIHQGVIGHLDEAAAQAAIGHYWGLLRTGFVDAIDFNHLSVDSPVFQGLMRFRPGWSCEKTLRASIHREMVLPAQPGYLEQKVRAKHRTWIKKKQRELETAFPDKVTWRWLKLKPVDDMAGLCAVLEAVAARTYQRGLGAGFFDNEEFRQRFGLFANQGRLRVYLVEIDGQAKAFWFGFVYQDVFHSSETGYDPELRDYEIGTLVFIRMVDELIKEGVKRLDFGLGDAHYKQRFGDLSWQEQSIWLFAPTAKGFLLRLLLATSNTLDRVARQILQKMNLTDKIKALWRRKKLQV